MDHNKVLQQIQDLDYLTDTLMEKSCVLRGKRLELSLFLLLGLRKPILHDVSRILSHIVRTTHASISPMATCHKNSTIKAFSTSNI